MNFFIFLWVAFFFGSGFVAIKVMLESLPAVQGAFYRLATATLFLFLMYRLQKKSIALPLDLLAKVWTAGLFMFGFPFAALFWGETIISAGLAGVICGTISLWTLVIGVLFFARQEKFSLSKLFGVLSGILGLVFIFLPSIQISGDELESWGIAAVVFSTICYGISANLNRKLFLSYPRLSLEANIFHQLFSSTVFTLLLSLFIEPFQWEKFMDLKLGLSALYVGVGSTALAYAGLYYLIRVWGSLRAMSATLLVPLIALGSDFIYYGNIPTSGDVLGTIAILMGLYLIQKPDPKE